MDQVKHYIKRLTRDSLYQIDYFFLSLWADPDPVIILNRIRNPGGMESMDQVCFSRIRCFHRLIKDPI